MLMNPAEILPGSPICGPEALWRELLESRFGRSKLVLVEFWFLAVFGPVLAGFGPVWGRFWLIWGRFWPGVEDICPEGRI